MRRLLIIFVVASCGRTGIGGALEPGLASPVDAGVTARDAGSPFDAGVAARDAGSVVRLPDGGCPGPRFATREALSRSPRPNDLAELAIVESGDQFVSDDETYRRAAADLAVLQRVDAGPSNGLGFLPDFLSSIIVSFNPDAGSITDGGYTAWECLNEAYRGQPTLHDEVVLGWKWAVIDFEPVIDVTRLVPEYERLPAVQFAEPNGLFFGIGCGAPSDLCLELGADGQFTWLAQLVEFRCAETVWLRLRSQADGGRELERVNTPPTAWFEAAPRCAMRLASRPWRHADGGIVEFDAGR